MTWAPAPLEFQTSVTVAQGGWDCPLLGAGLQPLSELTCCPLY